MAGYHFKEENDQDVSFIAMKVSEAWLTDCMEGYPLLPLIAYLTRELLDNGESKINFLLLYKF